MPETPSETDSTTDGVAVTNVKRWARVVAIIGPAIVSSVVAFVGAGESARNEAGEVKDKAEAGYQSTREALVEIQVSIRALHESDTKLAAEIADIKRRARMTVAKRRAETAAAARAVQPTVTVTVAPSPAPLPADLDKALAEQKATPK